MEPVLQGNLSSFRLPEVLSFLNNARKSGTLTVTSGAQQAYVHFRDGALIYAGSNQEQFRLGAILVHKKKITRAQEEAIDRVMRSEGGRFGEIAVQQGIVDEAQLEDFLKVQVSEILYDCFVWHGGSFAFTEETALPAHAVTISVDLANLIMEGARRIEEWEQCLRLLPDKTVVFRVVSRPSEEKITLSADEWKVLFLINGVRSLEELVHDSDEDAFHVYRVVYGLYANKLIEITPRVVSPNDSTGRPTGVHVAQQDETIRQAPAQFHGESTVREPTDDTSLLISSDAKLSYNDVVKPTIAQLTLGGNDGTTIPLSESEYLVGRHRDNQIHIADLGVSGFHCRIFRGTDGYVIEDLKSRNGVWLNGTRVFHAVLKDGDKLRLGATDLHYEVLYDVST